MGEKCDPIPGWILHDLRRTVATGMARLNFPPHVVDKVLNHASGTIRSVAPSIIDLSISRRRAALEAWGRYVANLVSPAAPSNVIAIAAR
jgi:integrase